MSQFRLPINQGRTMSKNTARGRNRVHHVIASARFDRDSWKAPTDASATGPRTSGEKNEATPTWQFFGPLASASTRCSGLWMLPSKCLNAPFCCHRLAQRDSGSTVTRRETIEGLPHKMPTSRQFMWEPTITRDVTQSHSQSERHRGDLMANAVSSCHDGSITGGIA